MELLIATRNQGKLREFQAILADLPVTLRSLDELGIADEIEETGTTFAENASLKAIGYYRLSGIPTIADDSGLEVAALNGAPGVYSARYGGVKGTAQLEYLLEQLRDVPWHQRVARFFCVLALTRDGETVEYAEGALPGVIELAPRGTGGFGYDPLLYLLDEDCTVAELPTERKNAISHRAQAVRAAHAVIEAWLAESR